MSTKQVRASSDVAHSCSELRDIQPPDVECNYPETQCFDHITLDWNPFGHPENGWFQPHFDFHIYMIPDSIRLSMHCEGFPPCLPGPGKEEFFMEPPEVGFVCVCILSSHVQVFFLKPLNTLELMRTFRRKMSRTIGCLMSSLPFPRWALIRIV